MASSPRARGRRPLVGGLALLVVLPLLTGCGSSHGTLSGRVMYRGQPVPGGWLTFRPADPKENSVHALIGADGHYEATLPAGDVAISVDNQEWAPKSSLGSIVPPVKLPPEAQPKAGAPAAPKADPEKHPGSYVEIPQKYANTETSGLHYTVKKGPDTHEIDLE